MLFPTHVPQEWCVHMQTSLLKVTTRDAAEAAAAAAGAAVEVVARGRGRNSHSEDRGSRGRYADAGEVLIGPVAVLKMLERLG